MATAGGDQGLRSRPSSPTTGVLNVDKPKGWTSHDVVACIRRLSGERRVGHTGTLDPLATGVLLLCIGTATRLAEYLVSGTKSYTAAIRLGVETDTFDADGRVVRCSAIGDLGIADLEQELQRFVGRIDQVAPMYSAVKHRGIPLHRLAREGITVERAPRQVEIHRIRIVAWRSPELILEIDCSKGTYVRSLAHDLGVSLGVGAHLANLVRTASGRFHLKHAATMDELLDHDHPGEWRNRLVPMSDALDDMPSVTVDERVARCIRFGQCVQISPPAGASLCCALDDGLRLLAILVPVNVDGLWRPHKVFSDA